MAASSCSRIPEKHACLLTKPCRTDISCRCTTKHACSTLTRAVLVSLSSQGTVKNSLRFCAGRNGGLPHYLIIFGSFHGRKSLPLETEILVVSFASHEVNFLGIHVTSMEASRNPVGSDLEVLRTYFHGERIVEFSWNSTIALPQHGRQTAHRCGVSRVLGHRALVGAR